MDTFLVISIVWIVSAPVLLILWLISLRKLKGQQLRYEKYSGIVDKEKVISDLQAKGTELLSSIEKVRNKYASKRKLLADLEAQVAIYDDRLAFAELGVYEPHFEFTDSEAFKQRIKAVRERQKKYDFCKKCSHLSNKLAS